MSCYLGLLPYLVLCLGVRATLICLGALSPSLGKVFHLLLFVIVVSLSFILLSFTFLGSCFIFFIFYFLFLFFFILGAWLSGN